MQLAALGAMIEHVVGGDERCVSYMCDVLKIFETYMIIAMMQHGDTKPDAVWSGGAEGMEE